MRSTTGARRAGIGAEARRRVRLGAAVVVTAALGLGLAGCNGYQSTSPSAARKHVAADGTTAAFAQGADGPVDCRKAKCVALTFDAGPSVRAPQIMSILRKYHVHATFFTLGKNHVMKHPQMVRDMVAQGDEVETLTWSHQILTKISSSEIRKEITEGRDAVQKVTGVRPMLLRPPQGRTSSKVTAIARDLGMAEVVWSANGQDYRTTDSALIAKRILQQTKPDGIILLHDLVDPTNKGYNGTVASIAPIVSTLQARGYTFVTVSQLLAPGTPQPGKVYK
ncbi:polysaccharide deacetylase family protein [Streptomyces sp. NPDC093221]|uniref:polysaccharide deacetylase family protein n=1 Tax=Streptomyces sp. NPDC093221 TaxID=3366032 RepID=UPI00382DFC80